MSSPPLVVPARFNGPASTANGGWVSGRLAGYLDPGLGAADPDRGCVQVRLLAPPPLEQPMPVTVDGTGAQASVAGVPVLQASLVDPAALPATPAPVAPEVARAAEAGYPGLVEHPFPTCVVCGPERGPGDGLRLFAGPVPGRPGTSAATWTPHPSLAGADGSVPAELCWAALDCPGGWSVLQPGRPMVLGTMQARVLRRPLVGEPCVVVGSRERSEGRRYWTSSALYGADSELLGLAGAIWITISPPAGTSRG